MKALIFLLLVSAVTAAEPLPLVVKEDFEQGAGRWAPTDAAAWKVLETPQGKVYNLFQQSKYKPPHRSPLNFALLKDTRVGDFELTVKVQSTVRDYDHRDLCLVFGYQDAAHFYYAHFGKKTDNNANQVFIVNGQPRTKISTKTSPGTPWTDAWHTLKLTRSVDSGAIAVFFNDLDNPVMTASDKTFAAGQVGVGSFDDTGNFDDLVLHGRVERAKNK